MPETSSHLRNLPRQARSAARVELLLDVAAEVFEDVGYDAATTNEMASRAGIPVGTLYRWFPDKAALAEGLTDRYLDQLVTLYAQFLTTIEPHERIGHFLHRVIGQLVDATRDQRALSALLLSAMVPGGRSPAGARLRDGLEAHIRAMITLRVPGVPEELCNRAAEVCVSLGHLVIAAAAEERSEREVMTGEYIDAMVAYLEAKFPSADHPAWTDPNAAVKPLFAAPDLASRLAAAANT